MKTKIYNPFKLNWRILLALMIINVSCKKFVNVDPPKTEIVSETVFDNDASSIAAIRGIYSLMISNQSFTNGYMELYSGLSADELNDFSTRQEQIEFYQNSLLATNLNIPVFWNEAYRYINNANAILEGVANSTKMTERVKDQLEGEARFVRAFCHFYLVNLFGDIPYVTTSDYKINSIAARSPVTEVYPKIINDLKSAENLLSSDFSFSNGERIQPNKSAATAMLARVYLYNGDWVKAEAAATSLISNTGIYSLATSLNDVFLKNSTETIWQLKPVVPGSNTQHARLFIIAAAPNNVSLRTAFYDAFDPDDMRKLNWVSSFTNSGNTYYFPYKYKALSSTSPIEYTMVLRLAEQFLIRAEARAHQENISGSQDDINAIRARAGLPNTTANDKATLLSAIENERKAELFAEWGHRWLDLKRTGRADAVLSPLKPGWQTTDVLYPIPQSERLLNSNLSQNPGY